MSKNHMAEVAKILGVELGESFKIVDDNGKYDSYYRITEENGIEVSDDNADWDMAIAGALKWLLTGEARIIKLPWKPKYGDTYYMPYVGDVNEDEMFSTWKWENDDIDRYRFRHGLVFRTKEEARAIAKKMLAVAVEAKKS